MRKYKWITPLLGLALASGASRGAVAQQASPLEGNFPPAAGPGGYVPPAPAGYGPPGYTTGTGLPVAPPPGSPAGAPTYTPVAPDAASGAGYPPVMQPWPGISPFVNGFEQTYNDDGMWFHETRPINRNYSFTAEFINGRFRNPSNATIGSLNAQQLSRVQDAGDGFDPTTNPVLVLRFKDGIVTTGSGRYFVANAGGNTGTLDPDGAFSATPVDRSFTSEVGGISTGIDITDLTGVPAGLQSRTPFYPVTGAVLNGESFFRVGGREFETGVYREEQSSPGLRLTFGVEDEDETGFDVTGWWLSAQPNLYQNGLGVNGTPRVTNAVLFKAPEAGTGANTVLPLTYNVLFKLEHESEVANTDINFYQTPLVDWGWLRLRSSIGARYTYIGEEFRFTGIDNGQEVVYNAFGVPLFNTGNDVLTLQTPGTAFNQATGFVQPIGPYETLLTSRVNSHLYGPQIGMNYEIGGDVLMVSGNGKFGLLGNTERIKIDGYGAGTTQAFTGQIVTFKDEQTHTHVSPVVEGTVNADLNIFPHIPILKRSSLLKNARLRGGYTGMAVFEMARPLDSINWRTEVLGGPHVSNTRGLWYTDFWSAGIHWEF